MERNIDDHKGTKRLLTRFLCFQRIVSTLTPYHMTTSYSISKQFKCRHRKSGPSIIVNDRSFYMYSEKNIKMAYNRYVQEETRKHIRLNLLRDSVFFQKNPCRKLPCFRPRGTLRDQSLSHPEVLCRYIKNLKSSHLLRFVYRGAAWQSTR
jgi:hypothetical protein